MESTTNESGNPLLRTEMSRRGTLTAAAWSVPVVALAASTPAAVASEPFDPLSDLSVAALGGAEGRYATGSDFTNGVVSPNTDFRRAFSVTNTGEGAFTGTLRIDFQFPAMWNQGGAGGDTGAFNNWGTVDLGGTSGGSIGGKTGWNVTPASTYTQNTGDAAWTTVWQRMDSAWFDLTNVSLPAGGTIWFALNATIPFSWIGSAGPPPEYLPDGRIYWRSPVSITATTTGGTNLGTFNTPVGSWANGIWYFNGGGPYAYEGGHGLYPNYGTA